MTSSELPEAGADPAPVSADSTIRTWLKHPRGATLLSQLLVGNNWSLEMLRGLSALPLRKVVPMSGGAITRRHLDELSARANEV